MEVPNVDSKHKKTILITGGTGNIGSKLVPELLARNYRIIIFTRDADRRSDSPDCRYAEWKPSELFYDKQAVAEADYIINLAGAGIADKKWSEERKQIIYDSRINSDLTIIKALSETENRVRAVVSASATGYYGHDKERGEPFVEDDPPGRGFMANICRDWERPLAHITELQKRLVILRTGVVLDKTSGMYHELAMPLKFRLATVLGTGKQMISWIHIADICRAYIHALENERVEGIYNACAPEPVSNDALVTEIATQKYGRLFLKMKVPAFLLKMIFGQMAEEALLISATVSSKKLEQSGFLFSFKNISGAIHDILKPATS